MIYFIFKSFKLLCVLVFFFSLQIQYQNARICNSMDIRDISHLERLTNCSVISGTLLMVLFRRNANNRTLWEKYSFPNLTEVTHNLIFYRVPGIRSIRKLFPNLAVIRGYKLLGNYAFVVYELDSLEEIGFQNFTIILRGGVRIQNNLKLCVAENEFSGKMDQAIQNVIIENKPKDECPTKEIYAVSHFKCHPYCLGGCFAENDPDKCFGCLYVRDGDSCLKKCPENKYLLEDYLCITEKQCLNHPVDILKPFNGSCVKSCPKNYETVSPELGYCKKCDGTCPLVCPGNIIIDIASAQRFRDCTSIHGSLNIRLSHNQETVKELHLSLDSIEEIDGALQIDRSFYLRSLNFFKRLRTITGRNANNSIVIYENDNLETLFNWNRIKKINIGTDNWLIHNNPNLCFSEIEKLKKVSGISKNFTVTEISPYSNGDRIVCGYEAINVLVDVVNSTSALIKWKHLNTSRLLGYQIYYMPAVVRNLTTEHFSDVCEHHSWEIITVLMEDIRNDTDYYNFSVHNLLPYTQYGLFVKTNFDEMSISAGVKNIAAQSDIYYFTTLADLPNRPADVYITNVTHNLINVSWDAPLRPNSKIDHYLVVAYLQREDVRYFDQNNYCISSILPFENVLKEHKTEQSSCSCMKENTFLEEDNFCTKKGQCKTFESEMQLWSELDQRLYNSISDNVTKTSRYNKNKANHVESKLVNGYSKIYKATVNDSSNYHIISKLLHYSKYVIYVSACSEYSKNNVVCSSSIMTSQRTSSKTNADLVMGFKVAEGRHDVTISWKEPRYPNGVTLFYVFEYVQVDVINASSKSICITRRDHEKAAGVYILNDLPTGSYKIRIRSRSLAKYGDYTNYITFTIEDTLGIYVIVSILVLFIIPTFICIYCVFWKKDRTKSKSWEDIIELENQNTFEIDSGDICDLETIVDQGIFGKLCKVKIKNDELCFAKLNKLNATQKEIDNFFSGMEVMKTIQYPFIVKIVGIVKQTEPHMILFEYCEKGVLSDYLRDKYLKHEIIPYNYIFKWSVEIADAMAYFERRNIVHGDLATRNIFLTDNYTIKLTNFGIGQTIDPLNYVNFKRHDSVGLRWMPKEVFENKDITHETDVWCYGIVLWEICNHGSSRKPYSEMTDDEVISFVCTGGRLDTPFYMPVVLEKIMRACFKDSDERPRFEDIVKVLDRVTDDYFKNSSVCYYDEPISVIHDNLESVSFLKQANKSDITNREYLLDLFCITDSDWEEWDNRGTKEQVNIQFSQDPDEVLSTVQIEPLPKPPKKRKNTKQETEEEKLVDINLFE